MFLPFIFHKNDILRRIIFLFLLQRRLHWIIEVTMVNSLIPYRSWSVSCSTVGSESLTYRGSQSNSHIPHPFQKCTHLSPCLQWEASWVTRSSINNNVWVPLFHGEVHTRHINWCLARKLHLEFQFDKFGTKWHIHGTRCNWGREGFRLARYTN